MEKNRERLYF